MKTAQEFGVAAATEFGEATPGSGSKPTKPETFVEVGLDEAETIRQRHQKRRRNLQNLMMQDESWTRTLSKTQNQTLSRAASSKLSRKWSTYRRREPAMAQNWKTHAVGTDEGDRAKVPDGGLSEQEVAEGPEGEADDGEVGNESG